MSKMKENGFRAGLKVAVLNMLPLVIKGKVHPKCNFCNYLLTRMLSRTEMAKVHTSFTPVEVQLLMFKNTLVKVEVLATLFFYSS